MICDAPDGKLSLAGLDAVERDRALLPIFFCMETCTRTGINVSSISIVAAAQRNAMLLIDAPMLLAVRVQHRERRKKNETMGVFETRRCGCGGET